MCHEARIADGTGQFKRRAIASGAQEKQGVAVGEELEYFASPRKVSAKPGDRPEIQETVAKGQVRPRGAC